MKVLTRDEMIKVIKDRFILNAVPSEEFGEDYKGGIWIKDDMYRPYFEYYDHESTLDEDHFFNKALKEHSWYAEPYDAETILLWKM